MRFALDDDIELQPAPAPAWLETEDFLHSDDEQDGGDGRRSSEGGHRPLLEDREAPSVRVANEMDEGRAKSGMKMAFMNMANSIIGAGIIGQPYAFKQAGLGMGVGLLVGLTFIVSLLAVWGG